MSQKAEHKLWKMSQKGKHKLWKISQKTKTQNAENVTKKYFLKKHLNSSKSVMTYGSFENFRSDWKGNWVE